MVAVLRFQKHQIMKNLKAVLHRAGSSLEDVVEVNVFLTNIDDADLLSSAYKEYWGDLMPARTYVRLNGKTSRIC